MTMRCLSSAIGLSTLIRVNVTIVILTSCVSPSECQRLQLEWFPKQLQCASSTGEVRDQKSTSHGRSSGAMHHVVLQRRNAIAEVPVPSSYPRICAPFVETHPRCSQCHTGVRGDRRRRLMLQRRRRGTPRWHSQTARRQRRNW